MSHRIEELDAIVRRFDLNGHPLYPEWRAGTLPIERLAQYADEQGLFIGIVDRGWDPIGYSDYAAEERRHDELWTRFRTALGATGAMARAQSETLLAVGEAFASVPESMGRCTPRDPAAEDGVPQTGGPGTSTTPASVGADAQRYFVEHVVETDEPAMLVSRIDGLADSGFARAKTACAIFSAPAGGAPDGVYSPIDQRRLGARASR